MKGKLVSLVAHVATFVIFGSAALVVHGARGVRGILAAVGLSARSRPPGEMRLLITGTFYNENWIRSHLLPLSEARVLNHVYVVTDQSRFAVDGVTYVCPPPWMARLLTRPLTRLMAIFWVTLRHQPEILMGYHIMPNALLCLVVASLFGKRSAYQMTGGPIQIIGGGTGSENALLCRLKRRSPLLEGMLYHLVRQFDLLVCRGERAVAFAEEHRLARRTLIVQGSVDTTRFAPSDAAEKTYDLVLVARHIAEKQPLLFVEIVDQLRRIRPDVRAALVGDGPLTPSAKELAERLGVGDCARFLGNLSRVDQVLAESRLFMLTSKTEGLSIAMVEAMAAGLPVLAPDVGELGFLLRDGETGLFIRPEQTEATARQVADLLDDPERLARMSAAARQRVVEFNSVEAVARRWDECLPSLVHASGSGERAYCPDVDRAEVCP